MQKDYKTLFSTLSPVEPPKGLHEAIVARIERRVRRLAALRATFPGLTTLISLSVAIPVLQSVMQDLSSSGFFHYTSLLFSDGTVVLIYWKEFSLLLAESLPFMGIIILLSLILTFLGSLRSAARNTRIALSHFHFIS